jgi:hypothetical protein
MTSRLARATHMYEYLSMQPIFFPGSDRRWSRESKLSGQLTVRLLPLAIRPKRVCESYPSSASEFAGQTARVEWHFVNK